VPGPLVGATICLLRRSAPILQRCITILGSDAAALQGFLTVVAIDGVYRSATRPWRRFQAPEKDKERERDV
jgi:hypothetical protein